MASSLVVLKQPAFTPDRDGEEKFLSEVLSLLQRQYRQMGIDPMPTSLEWDKEMERSFKGAIGCRPDSEAAVQAAARKIHIRIAARAERERMKTAIPCSFNPDREYAFVEDRRGSFGVQMEGLTNPHHAAFLSSSSSHFK